MMLILIYFVDLGKCLEESPSFLKTKIEHSQLITRTPSKVVSNLGILVGIEQPADVPVVQPTGGIAPSGTGPSIRSMQN